jgi:hypothetical protein
VYVTSSEALESAVLRRTNSPILWDEVMNGFIGCEILICVGPGKQVAEWAELKYPDKEIYTVEGLADLEKIKKMLLDDAHATAVSKSAELQDGSISFGVCHLDDKIVQLSSDLTVADEINELPGDYDVDEDEEGEE